MAEDTLNDQITDSVEYANYTVVGNAVSQSMGMLDALMAETIGMAMHNAVNTQHNAQMVSSAAVTAACARMLKAQSIPWLPTPAAPVNPTVTGVAPLPGEENGFTVEGSGFNQGLAVDIYQNGALLGTVSGSAITAVKPASFEMQSPILTPTQTYMLQVVNPDQGRSAPFNYTVPQPPANPTVATVTLTQPAGTGNPTSQYTVTGTNFKAGLSVDLSAGPTMLGTLSGASITSVQPTSFVMATNLLAKGGTFGILVIGPDNLRSVTTSFSVPAVS